MFLAIEFNQLGKNTAEEVVRKASEFVGDPTLLIAGIVLIVAALLVFFFLKKIIANTIAGLIVWAIVYFLFDVHLPVLPTLALTVVFGLGGIGSMLLLKFFGWI
jgi:uncharacterized membrane protein YgcG